MLDTYNWNDAKILYDYSCSVLEDFGNAPPTASDEEQAAHEADVLARAKHPGFKRALVHVAYQRGNPGESASKVKEIVGRANMLEVTVALYEDVDESDGGDPLTETPSSASELENGSESLTTSKRPLSGATSSITSDRPVDRPALTGITESASPSPR